MSQRQKRPTLGSLDTTRHSTMSAFISFAARLANVANMAVTSLIVAIVALVIALASAVFTRRQASAAGESLRIERRRRNEERRPRLTGKVDSPDRPGDSVTFWAAIRVDLTDETNKAALAEYRYALQAAPRTAPMTALSDLRLLDILAWEPARRWWPN